MSFSKTFAKVSVFRGPVLTGGRNHGFTIIELLVSSLILTVAVSGSVIAYNLITRSADQTGVRLDQNRLIDADLATIRYRAELFTSCLDPEGDVNTATPGDPVSCTGDDVDFGNSFYYFPELPLDAQGNVTDDSDAITFGAACTPDSGTGTTTLRTNFLNVIGGEVELAGNVTRQAPTAVTGTSYLVRITWVDPTRNNRELRSVDLAPVVSAWCQ